MPVSCIDNEALKYAKKRERKRVRERERGRGRVEEALAASAREGRFGVGTLV